MKNLKINLANLKNNPAGSEFFAFNLPTKDIFPESSKKEPGYSFWENGFALIEGRSVNKEQFLEISGKIKVSLSCPCSRCLQEAKLIIDAPFSQKYQETGENHTLTQIEPVESADDLNYYSGNELDLRLLVREVLLLAQPLSYLCQENCRGLCPECGTNLNISDCGCAGEKIDARLAILKKLTT